MCPKIPGLEALKLVGRKSIFFMSARVFLLSTKFHSSTELFSKFSPGKSHDPSNTYHGRKIAKRSGAFQQGRQEHWQWKWVHKVPPTTASCRENWQKKVISQDVICINRWWHMTYAYTHTRIIQVCRRVCTHTRIRIHMERLNACLCVCVSHVCVYFTSACWSLRPCLTPDQTKENLMKHVHKDWVIKNLEDPGGMLIRIDWSNSSTYNLCITSRRSIESNDTVLAAKTHVLWKIVCAPCRCESANPLRRRRKMRSPRSMPTLALNDSCWCDEFLHPSRQHRSQPANQPHIRTVQGFALRPVSTFHFPIRVTHSQMKPVDWRCSSHCRPSPDLWVGANEGLHQPWGPTDHLVKGPSPQFERWKLSEVSLPVLVANVPSVPTISSAAPSDDRNDSWCASLAPTAKVSKHPIERGPNRHLPATRWKTSEVLWTWHRQKPDVFKVPGLEKQTYLDLSAILISRFWTRPPKNSWLTVLRHGSHGTYPWTPPAYSHCECGVKLPKDLGILGSLTLAKGIARPGHRGMAGPSFTELRIFFGAQKALMGIIWNDIMKASPNWIMLDHGRHALSPSAT